MGPMYKNATFALMSTGGFAQPEWSPCSTMQIVILNAMCSLKHCCLSKKYLSYLLLRGQVRRVEDGLPVLGALLRVQPPAALLEGRGGNSIGKVSAGDLV